MITSRSEAKLIGSNRYFTGKPCCRGHFSERFTNSGRCIECNKVLCSNWQKNNKELCNKIHRDSYHKNINDRRLYCRNRRKDPKILAKHNAINAEWRKNNPEYFNQWAIKNPEKNKSCDKAYSARRRARKVQSGGNHTPSDIRKIYDMQKGKCVYCKIDLKETGYEVDHIIPISKGGSNWPTNLQILCGTIEGHLSCNNKKRDKDPIVFANSIGLLV